MTDTKIHENTLRKYNNKHFLRILYLWPHFGRVRPRNHQRCKRWTDLCGNLAAGWSHSVLSPPTVQERAGRVNWLPDFLVGVNVSVNGCVSAVCRPCQRCNEDVPHRSTQSSPGSGSSVSISPLSKNKIIISPALSSTACANATCYCAHTHTHIYNLFFLLSYPHLQCR